MSYLEFSKNSVFCTEGDACQVFTIRCPFTAMSSNELNSGQRRDSATFLCQSLELN